MTAWPRRRVADLIDVLTAGVSVRSTTAAVGGPGVLKTSAIDAGHFDPTESKTILPADLPRARCPVAADSMIVSRMNTPAMVGDVGYVAEAHDDIFLPDRLWLARAKRRSSTDMRWLTYYFASEPGARELRGLATGTSGSMKNIPKERVLGLQIGVPPEAEQRAIARTLADADDLIATLERLIVKKQAIKRGMMQQLLTGRTRLPGFGEKWRRTSIGDIANQHRRTVDPRKEPDRLFQHFSLPAFDDGAIPQVVPGAKIESIKFFVPSEAILVSKLNPRIPRIWAPTEIGENAVASTEFVVMTAGPGVSPSFLKWLMKSDAVISPMKRLATGTTGSHARIHPRQIAALKVVLPDEVEQLTIAAVLDDASRELQLLRARLTKARTIKTGMMQQLLTGRTRLPVEVES